MISWPRTWAGECTLLRLPAAHSPARRTAPLHQAGATSIPGRASLDHAPLPLTCPHPCPAHLPGSVVFKLDRSGACEEVAAEEFVSVPGLPLASFTHDMFLQVGAPLAFESMFGLPLGGDWCSCFPRHAEWPPLTPQASPAHLKPAPPVPPRPTP